MFLVSGHIRLPQPLLLAEDAGTSDRSLLARNTIALLSTPTGGNEPATSTWLGHSAAAPKVRESSLWNVNHVDESFDPRVTDILQAHVRETS